MDRLHKLIPMPNLFCILFLFLTVSASAAQVELGIDRFCKEDLISSLGKKKVGLVVNHTSVDSQLKHTIELFQAKGISVVALFAPEHGIDGRAYAFEEVKDAKGPNGIPIYSLHGKTRRPTDRMLKGIDVLVYDVQDIGVRSYTYASTLFYVMEEAAKRGIEVIVLDRPNPINGLIVDGPMLKEKWRSFIGYINVPYCHGMTIGELAQLFNTEYKVKCRLKVIAMKGWKRSMSFKQTGLSWIAPSPQIPESDTPLFYASTGILGELKCVNIGVGYTLPFKVVGAPWINAKDFTQRLNAHKLPGVSFTPFYYRPFFGSYKGLDCQGTMIVVTDHLRYRPLAVQYLLIGMLKALYPKKVDEKIAALDQESKNLFCKANGNEEMLAWVRNEKYVAWKMIEFQKEQREAFKEKRAKYLLY